MKQQTHSDRGLQWVLTIPKIFLYFQRLVGLDRYYSNLVKDYLHIKEGMSILDIGCGCAYICEYLPENVRYVGLDMNESYINYAKRKYKHGHFYTSTVNAYENNKKELFDFVISLNVVHHLNDDDTMKLYKTGYEYLKNGGTMLVSDPSYHTIQSRLSKFLCKIDRGKNIRTPEEYSNLAKNFFNNVLYDIRYDFLNTPQVTTIVTSIK